MTSVEQPRTAVDSGNFLDKMRSEFNELLNNPIFDPALQPLEQQYNIKREHVGFAVAGVLALYLVLGSAAQLLCNIIGFGYPAYVSVKAIRTKETVDDTQVSPPFILFLCIFNMIF